MALRWMCDENEMNVRCLWYDCENNIRSQLFTSWLTVSLLVISEIKKDSGLKSCFMLAPVDDISRSSMIWVSRNFYELKSL